MGQITDIALTVLAYTAKMIILKTHVGLVVSWKEDMGYLMNL